jgi:hypothetical protein
MPDFSTIIGYLSGIHFIDPELEASSLIPTLIAIHFFDGILCFLIARHSGRNDKAWALVGFVIGVWGVLPLLLLPERRDQA